MPRFIGFNGAYPVITHAEMGIFRYFGKMEGDEREREREGERNKNRNGNKERERERERN